MEKYPERVKMASIVISKNIYSGRYQVIHNPLAKGSSPRYRVIGDGGHGEETRPFGVTSILGKVLAKDLIGWALGSYEKELLVRLAANGRIDEEDITESKQSSAKKRDAGADTGSIVHAAVEAYLRGGTSISYLTKEGAKAYGAFVKWFEGVKPEVLGVEDVIYSKSYDYAGTFDCMLRIGGKVYLCDLKTTNASKTAKKGVYPEMFLQLGGYAWAYGEERLYDLAETGESQLYAVDGLMVISAKKDGKLDIVTNEDVGIAVDECGSRFIEVVDIFNYLKETERRLK